MAIPNTLNPLKIPDFNADGRTDIFSFNPNTGVSQITLIDGLRSLGSSSFPANSRDWQPSKFGDFNGDRKTDLVWRNTKTGGTEVWLINGTSIQAKSCLETLQGNWTETIGDFDANGKSDFFWYNSTTGDYNIWLMNGTQRVKQSSGEIGAGWEIAIADFNNDQQTDLFLRNPLTGENAVATIDLETLAIKVESTRSKSPTSSAEIIDFNGDGRSDVFWRDRLTGQNQLWVWSTDLQPLSFQFSLPGRSRDFVIKTADFDGNGKTDFLVRNPSSGVNQVWLSGTALKISPIATQSAGFQPTIGDYNGDGFSDIRWTSTDGTQSTVWFSNGNLPQVQ
ncbi:VCBS repeat-containing protein [Leptolyngbya sp. DQ-M1]|uniref:FG-GAP repeat domain-containing protein n=1 Tax=Leptolyngbya sp. DQ-M1 TaxID=2933920 RepID=UPI003297A80F